MFQVAQPKNTTVVMAVRRKSRFEIMGGTKIGRIYPLIGIIRVRAQRKRKMIFRFQSRGEIGRYGLVGNKEFGTYYL